MKARVRSQVRKRRISRRAVSEFARFVMRRAGLRGEVELSVMFVGRRAMRRLNREYLGRDSDTDVLAFPVGTGRGVYPGVRLLGDVVISVDRAEAQARRFKSSLNHEILLYIAHGILHLCGADDATAAMRADMWKRQERILTAAYNSREWNVIS